MFLLVGFVLIFHETILEKSCPPTSLIVLANAAGLVCTWDLGPPDPKISIFRPPPILIFISLMVSLGVAKSQTDEVSFKSARISP